MADLLTAENLLALATLSAMEIVLGIDNIVFISILTGRLHPSVQGKVRQVGLAMAMVMRIGLLFAISWIMRLTAPLFPIMGHEVTGKDLVLILGGGFLIFKATKEIHHKLEVHEDGPGKKPMGLASIPATLAQIVMIDIVFSLDSVITAVGMARSIYVMVTAVIISVIVMMIFAGPISRFIKRHPSMKVLALSFLMLIGVLLVADGLGHHLPRGYVYFAMAFSLGVELINLRAGSRRPEASRTTV